METPSTSLGGQQGHPQNPRQPPALVVLSSWIQRGGSWAPPVPKLPLPLGRPCRAAGQDGAGPPGVQQLWLFLPAPPCRGHMAEPWPPAQQLRLRLMERRGGGSRRAPPAAGAVPWGSPRPSEEPAVPAAPPALPRRWICCVRRCHFTHRAQRLLRCPVPPLPAWGRSGAARHQGVVTSGDGDTRPWVTHGHGLVACWVPTGCPRACRSILAPPAERDGLERLMLPWGCVPKGAIPKAPGGMGTGT